MTRPLDRPLPNVALDDAGQIAAWPVRPVIAIGGTQDAAVWDDPALMWDVNDGGTVGPSTSRVGMAVVGTARVGAS